MTNQSSKSLAQTEGSMCGKELMKELPPPCITPTIKHREGSVVVWGQLLPIAKSGFAPGEGQIESVWEAFANYKVGDLLEVKHKLNQTGYCRITRSYLEHGLWVKDLYSCKIKTQSLLVNSARSTLKRKRNSMSFNWCLGRHNQQT